jgi:hypothetical protein
MSIDKTQIKIIHTLKSKLCMNEEEYRTVLAAYGATSSTGLSYLDAKKIIDRLTPMALACGVWEKTPRKRSTITNSERGDMASLRQQRMIEAKWAQVSRAKDAQSRRKALDLFIHRRFHRGGLEMVERELVARISHAIEEMAMNDRRKAERRERRESLKRIQEEAHV